MTYGDQIAALALEVTACEILAEKCLTVLGKSLMLYHRYVDDMAGWNIDPVELMEAIADVTKVLEDHGFSFKKIFSNGLFHKKLNPDGSSQDGQFSMDEANEIFFHHNWNFRLDELSNLPDLNPNKKIGVPTLVLPCMKLTYLH